MLLGSPPIAPISAAWLLIFLVQMALLLALALCLGRLAIRLGTAAIVGELLTGVLLGPSVLGHLAPSVENWILPHDGQTTMIGSVGQVGVLLLVGMTGAQLDEARWRRNVGPVVSVGLGALLIPLALGVGAGFLLPGIPVGPGHSRTTLAVLLGVAMCVTALPVIAKTLSDLGLLHTEIGHLIIAGAMFDDAIGWLLLSVVAAMDTAGVRTGPLVMAVVYLVAFLAVSVLGLRPLIGWLMRRARRIGDSGPSVAAAVVIIIVCGATTQALGMEAIFGAFVGGVLVGRPHAADPATLTSLRTVVLSVFAPLFLATAGLNVDIAELGRPDVLLVAAVLLVLAIVGKFVGAYAGARVARLSHWEGLALGAGMNARGIVEVVIATAGLRLGLLNTAMYTIVILIALTTSVMAPSLLRWSVSRMDGAVRPAPVGDAGDLPAPAGDAGGLPAPARSASTP